MSNWAEVFEDLGFVAADSSVDDWEQFLSEPGEGASADDVLDGLLAQLVAAASDDDLDDDLFVPRGVRRTAPAEEPVAEAQPIDDEPAFAEVDVDVDALTVDPAVDPAVDLADTNAGAPLDLDDVVIEFEPVVALDDERPLPDEPQPLDDDLL